MWVLLCNRKNLFKPYGASTVPLSFRYSIILKILTFSYTLLSVRRPIRKTSVIPTYHSKSRERLHLKDNTKNSIKIMEISSLLNTDLGN